jgi:hypothetical protein
MSRGKRPRFIETEAQEESIPGQNIHEESDSDAKGSEIDEDVDESGNIRGLIDDTEEASQSQHPVFSGTDSEAEPSSSRRALNTQDPLIQEEEVEAEAEEEQIVDHEGDSKGDNEPEAIMPINEDEQDEQDGEPEGLVPVPLDSPHPPSGMSPILQPLALPQPSLTPPRSANMNMSRLGSDQKHPQKSQGRDQSKGNKKSRRKKKKRSAPPTPFPDQGTLSQQSQQHSQQSQQSQQSPRSQHQKQDRKGNPPILRSPSHIVNELVLSDEEEKDPLSIRMEVRLYPQMHRNNELVHNYNFGINSTLVIDDDIEKTNEVLNGLRDAIVKEYETFFQLLVSQKGQLSKTQSETQGIGIMLLGTLPCDGEPNDLKIWCASLWKVFLGAFMTILFSVSWFRDLFPKGFVYEKKEGQNEEHNAKWKTLTYEEQNCCKQMLGLLIFESRQLPTSLASFLLMCEPYLSSPLVLSPSEKWRKTFSTYFKQSMYNEQNFNNQVIVLELLRSLYRPILAHFTKKVVLLGGNNLPIRISSIFEAKTKDSLFRFKFTHLTHIFYPWAFLPSSPESSVTTTFFLFSARWKKLFTAQNHFHISYSSFLTDIYLKASENVTHYKDVIFKVGQDLLFIHDLFTKEVANQTTKQKLQRLKKAQESLSIFLTTYLENQIHAHQKQRKRYFRDLIKEIEFTTSDKMKGLAEQRRKEEEEKKARTGPDKESKYLDVSASSPSNDARQPLAHNGKSDVKTKERGSSDVKTRTRFCRMDLSEDDDKESHKSGEAPIVRIAGGKGGGERKEQKEESATSASSGPFLSPSQEGAPFNPEADDPAPQRPPSKVPPDNYLLTVGGNPDENLHRQSKNFETLFDHLEDKRAKEKEIQDKIDAIQREHLIKIKEVTVSPSNFLAVVLFLDVKNAMDYNLQRLSPFLRQPAFQKNSPLTNMGYLKVVERPRISDLELEEDKEDAKGEHKGEDENGDIDIDHIACLDNIDLLQSTTGKQKNHTNKQNVEITQQTIDLINFFLETEPRLYGFRACPFATGAQYIFTENYSANGKTISAGTRWVCLWKGKLDKIPFTLEVEKIEKADNVEVADFLSMGSNKMKQKKGKLDTMHRKLTKNLAKLFALDGDEFEKSEFYKTRQKEVQKIQKEMASSNILLPFGITEKGEAFLLCPITYRVWIGDRALFLMNFPVQLGYAISPLHFHNFSTTSPPFQHLSLTQKELKENPQLLFSALLHCQGQNNVEILPVLPETERDPNVRLNGQSKKPFVKQIATSFMQKRPFWNTLLSPP